MEFITVLEAHCFFYQEVYKGEEKDELFLTQFQKWVDDNDITIAEIDFPEEPDFSGSTNDDR